MLRTADFYALTGAKVPEPPREHTAPKGEGHWKSRLTNAQVKAMRERYAVMRGTKVIRHRYGYSNLAREFNCGRTTARAIVMGWTRKDAGGPTFDDPDA